VRWVLGLLCCLSFFVGCGPYMEDVSKEHRPRIEQKVLAVQAIGHDAAVQPLAASESLTGGADVRAALVLYLEDFRELSELSAVYARASASRLFPDCVALVRTEHRAWDARKPDTLPSVGRGYSAAPRLETCERAPHLFVIRTAAFAKPSEPKYAPSAASAKSADAGSPSGEYVFEGGFVGAEVVVYAIEGARRLGAFRIEAENSDRVRGITPDDLESDLRSSLDRALAEGVRARMPNAVFEEP
jgi:hypothetical protein